MEKTLGQVFWEAEETEVANILGTERHRIAWKDVQEADQKLIEVGISAAITEWQRRNAEPVAQVKVIKPMECLAIVEWFPKQNGHFPFDIGDKLFLASQPDMRDTPPRSAVSAEKYEHVLKERDDLRRELAKAREEAERWQMLPAFIAEHQINYVLLKKQIDEAIFEKHGNEE